MTAWIGTKLGLARTGCVLALLAASVARAQAPDEGPGTVPADEIEVLEPAVDTSAAPMTDEPAASEPDAAVAAADVSRSRAGGAVMDRMDLGRTEITGNQELPKVLYIVPWQKADPGDLMGKPVNTLLDEVLAPVDREEFLRSRAYYDELYGSGGD